MTTPTIHHYFYKPIAWSRWRFSRSHAMVVADSAEVMSQKRSRAFDLDNKQQFFYR